MLDYLTYFKSSALSAVAGVALVALGGCAVSEPLEDLTISHSVDASPTLAVEVEPLLTEPEILFEQVGTASWYGPGFHGRTTASGEVYDQYAMTAAHRELDLPTTIEVTNLANCG